MNDPTMFKKMLSEYDYESVNEELLELVQGEMTRFGDAFDLNKIKNSSSPVLQLAIYIINWCEAVSSYQ